VAARGMTAVGARRWILDNACSETELGDRDSLWPEGGRTPEAGRPGDLIHYIGMVAHFASLGIHRRC
jgi:hypothetical protein